MAADSRNALGVRAAVFLFVVLALLAVPPVLCVAQGPTSAPTNPAFVDYINNVYGARVADESSADYPLGLVPAPIDLSHTSGQHVFQNDIGPMGLPVSFDLRSQSSARLTAVRNQGGCGSCWAFACYGSLESCLLPSETLDFSENNMKNTHGFDWTCCEGGNQFICAAYLARWSGTLAESSDPYNAGSCASPTGGAITRHVQRVLFLPDRAGSLDNDNIKQAVMDYGAVYTTFYWSDGYYNSGSKAYYYSGGNGANHAVGIVGWNDDFDKSNFSVTPPGNGAFIIRNSWGPSWGQSGYFYISYYDSRIGKDNAVFYSADSATAYNQVYQYDPLGWVSSLGYGSSIGWFANVFTAASSGQLMAASFYTSSPGASYQLSVYLDPTSGPVGGSPVATKTGTISGYGYETVALDAPVQLTTSHKFSVVVKLTTPGYNFPIPYEYPLVGYSSGATSQPGESYISYNGTSWSDITSSYANANVCLKAFTRESGGLTVMPALGLAADGPVGGPFSPASQVYTLTNNGLSSISWTASKSESWVSVSPTSGTLGPGLSTGVTVSLNSAASGLTAGSYSDSVSFANTTDGAGDTTRDVSLLVFDNYQIKPGLYQWINPADHTSISLGDDGVSPAQTLPFSFRFYEKTYNQIYVAANGMLGFSSDGLGAYSNTDIPNVANPNAVMYPYWDDLNPTASGSVRIGTYGVAPNRKVVVSWVGVPQYSAASYPFTFQVLLCEGSHDIVFQYKEVQIAETHYGSGRSATIGIENGKGTVAARYCFNGSTFVRKRQAILFTTRGLFPGEIKQAVDGSPISTRRAIVSAVFGDAFYIEADDRSSGIRVLRPGHGVAAGARVDVTGVMRTAAWGERYIDASSVFGSGSGSVAPLALIPRGVGGAGFRYSQGSTAGQEGMKGRLGASNIGMLLRTAGRVTYVGPGFFIVDDRSEIMDPSGHPGVRIDPGAAPMPALGSFVQATGIASCFSVGDDLYPVLLVTDASGVITRQ